MDEKFRFYALKMCGLCIFVFILQITIPGFTELFLLNKEYFLQIWRFLTAIFLHGNIIHILYNLFALALFGSILERFIGGRKFLIIFFVTGILANLVAVNFYSSSLGASGAIFGIIGALLVIRPGIMVFAFGLPMPLFIAGILWALGDFIGLFVPSNVGNIAHLSGMFFGLIFGAVYRNWKYKKIMDYEKYLDERYMRNWENNYLR